MRRRLRDASPFRAGLVAVVLAAVAVYLAFSGSLPWESSYQLKAVLSSGNELHSRTPVRVAGIDVGKVSSVESGPGHTAVVTLDLEERALPIHADATLKVRPRIFLEGNFFVDLQPGTPSAPEVGSGHTIPLANTAVPVQLDQVLDTLNHGTRENLRGVVHELAIALDEGGARALNRSVAQWGPAFREGAIAAEAVRGRHDHDVSGFIADGERTARALASRQSELADLVTGLARTAGALASRRAALEATLPELAAAVREGRPTYAALNRLFPTARAFAVEVRPGLRAAPATLRLANPLLAQLQGLLGPGELPELVRVGDPAIRSLARLQPPLRSLLRRLWPVTECARRNVLPVLFAKIEDGHLTSPFPVYSELFHGWVGLASAVQNFDGNGHAVRYHAGFGNQTITTGQVPGLVEPLVGVTENPILGSRPKKPATGMPPFRPDVPCISQKPVDLHAETGPAIENAGPLP